MVNLLKITFSLVLLFFAAHSYAATYTLANKQDSVIGNLTTTYSEEKDTLLDIARSYGLGYQDIKLVNPGVDTWLPGAGAEINLPLQFVLPDTPRKGIVLNIPEMRLYYFPEHGKNKEGEMNILTYPLGVGREGWSTPYMKTKIIEKKENPKWHPPKSIRKEHEEAGDPLPEVVEAGPDNPLGAFAMRLGRPEYLIHGTNKPFGIGMRVSHGCIRLYPEDIEQLFSKVKIGTRVEIVNQPYKVGEKEGVLYLEAHPHLEEDAEHFEGLTPVVDLIVAANHDDRFEVDWDRVRKTVRSPAGVPVPIGKARPELEEEPSLQVAELVEPEVMEEIAEEPSPVPTKSQETEKIEPKVVVPRKVTIKKPSLRKSRDNQLNLRMDTELNP